MAKLVSPKPGQYGLILNLREVDSFMKAFGAVNVDYPVELTINLEILSVTPLLVSKDFNQENSED